MLLLLSMILQVIRFIINIYIFKLDKDSFLHITQWLEDIKDAIMPTAIYAYVGNKLDLADKRQISKEEGEQFARENNSSFQEVSAKTGQNINNLFYKDILDQISRARGGKGHVEKDDKGINIIKYYLLIR